MAEAIAIFRENPGLAGSSQKMRRNILERFREAPLPVEVVEDLNEALADKIREGEFQRAVREMGQKLEFIAKELDQIVAESEATAKKPSKKKNPPA